MSPGGPIWGVAVLLMLVTLIVLTVVRLRRSGAGTFPVKATIGVVVGVLVLCGLVLAFGGSPR